MSGRRPARAAWHPRDLDRIVTERAIAGFMEGVSAGLSGVVLDVGCGDQPYRSKIEEVGASYIGLDLEPTRYRPPDLVYDGSQIPLPDSSIDAAIATEVFEHIEDPQPLLRELRRVLRPGGRLHLTVPFLWPLHDVPDDMYRYTPYALERALSRAGFGSVELHALGGWDASLAQLLGLWARRRPMRRPTRALVSLAVLPAVRFLCARDEPPVRFRESTMITGLRGHAIRPPVRDTGVDAARSPGRG